MSEKKLPKISPQQWIRIGLAALAVLFLVLTVKNMPFWQSERSEQNEPDDIMGYKDSEITEIIAGENRELKQLIVYEQDLEASMDITDMFLNIEWFKKKQTVHLSATAEYIIDLSKINSYGISVNRNDRVITVTIPRAELKNVVIDFDKTTFDDIERNIFGWGDIKLTPEQTNEVEKDLQAALLEEASETPYLSAADMAAMRQVEAAYRKVLTNLHDDVEIIAVLDMNLNN
ncbi:MAG: DUF4230 domain-containing protein [Solobacterium sp.]|nr:DUF4230 domain-containing protein [Solobacterium sp.]